MLGFGGAGGIINMSYQLNTTIHNTQWITGHFHLIFGGAIVIMYFAIAYDLWPHLTGRALPSEGLIRTQLWLWFIGMIVTTFPWHYVGILGMPRRMAYFDFSNPALAPEALSTDISVFGGLILLVAGLLFVFILIRGNVGPTVAVTNYQFCEALHPPTALPAALNGYALWVALMIGLTVTNYGFPIAALLTRTGVSVPAVYVGTHP
jgi:cytochrome c oxidase subunit 1